MAKLITATFIAIASLIVLWCVFASGYYLALQQNWSSVSAVYSCNARTASFLSERIDAHDISKVSSVLTPEDGLAV